MRLYLSFFALTAALLASQAAQAAGPTGLLNDTGQTKCNNGIAMVACDAATTGDASARPRQDGRFGRDVAAPAKVGGGDAGFDFTKVCMNGTLNCAGGAQTGAGTNAVGGGFAATEWTCTRDNVTNLIWSLHSGSGGWTTYARTTLPAAHNAQSRCGYSSGWRLPTRRELLSIVNTERDSPSIDSTYFPGTRVDWYWTNDPHQSISSYAWYVNFSIGDTFSLLTTLTGYVRLVRSGP